MSDSPTNTYNSATSIFLSHVPEVEDPDLYNALLDIHNAIDALITSSDLGDAAFTEYLAKLRSVRRVSESVVTIFDTDGMVEIDASTQSIVVYLYEVEDKLGYEVHIKRIDSSSNTVEIIPYGTDTLDGFTSDTLDPLDSYHLKASEEGWSVI